MDVETRLPKLLESMDGWSARLLTNEKPHVERLFREDGDNRIYLHRIHKCDSDEALFHSHPWPAAMRVVQGWYKMHIGICTEISFHNAATLIIGPGTIYEMNNVNAKHSVCPVTDTTLSLMVTGPIWSKSKVEPKRNPDLDSVRAEKLLEDFRMYYEGWM